MVSILKKIALASPPGRRLTARIDAMQARIAELEARATPAPPVRVAYAIEVLWRDIDRKSVV